MFAKYKRNILAPLAACLLSMTLATGCAEKGLRQDLFGHWHETMVLFRDYQNGNLVAADSTQDQLYNWRFKRDGNGLRTREEIDSIAGASNGPDEIRALALQFVDQVRTLHGDVKGRALAQRLADPG